MEQFSLEKYLENPSRKVVTRSGHNVRILCTDQRGNMPIVALVEFETLDGVQIFYSDGKNESHREYDLFFADEEEKLTEFESKLADLLVYNHPMDIESAEDIAKRKSKQLLDLARKELRKEQQEKLGTLEMPIDVIEPYYIQGKQDALKDLPKWKKTKKDNPYEPCIIKYTDYTVLETGGYGIRISELFEKLPKEE